MRGPVDDCRFYVGRDRVRGFVPRIQPGILFWECLLEGSVDLHVWDYGLLLRESVLNAS